MSGLNFMINSIYSRDEIHDKVGGSKQSYLPTVNNEVVCGCFRLDDYLNPGAPDEILIGDSKHARACATKLFDSGRIIPVFIKSESNAWEYVGLYRCVDYSEERSVLKQKEKENPNHGKITAVFWLEPAFTGDLERVLKTGNVDATQIEYYVQLTKRIARDQELIRQRKAMGISNCELCDVAFFETKSGELHCEMAHIVALKKYGADAIENTLLLCSWCHAQLDMGKDTKLKTTEQHLHIKLPQSKERKFLIAKGKAPKRLI